MKIFGRDTWATGKALGGSKAVVLITLPKSGSMFLYHTLQMTYGLETRQHFGGEFPDVEYNRNIISEMIGGPAFISQTHARASRHNLAVLDHFIDRAVVQVRDPRQALLSFVHMLDSHTKNSPLDRAIFNVDEAYYALSLGERISHQIEATFPDMVLWLQQWAQALTQPHKCQFLLSRFDDFAADPDGTIHEVAAYFGLPRAELSHPDTKRAHFRKGDTGEWRQVFTQDQIDKTTGMIPREVWELLGAAVPDGLAPGSGPGAAKQELELRDPLATADALSADATR